MIAEKTYTKPELIKAGFDEVEMPNDNPPYFVKVTQERTTIYAGTDADNFYRVWDGRTDCARGALKTIGQENKLEKLADGTDENELN